MIEFIDEPRLSSKFRAIIDGLLGTPDFVVRPTLPRNYVKYRAISGILMAVRSTVVVCCWWLEK